MTDKIEVGDVFEPAVNGKPSDAVEVTRLLPEGRVSCRKIDNSVTFDVVGSMFLDPLKWVRAGYMGSRALPIPPQRSADHVVPTPLPPAPARRLGDGLREVADLIDEREVKYGPAVESWKRIAAAVGVTPEQALLVLLEMKRERARHSPENPDHVRDTLGYLAILTELRRVGP